MGSIGDSLTKEKILDAYQRLKDVTHLTSMITSATTDTITGKKVYFKMENQQKTGAFKFRGASYKLMNLSEEELRRGVVTASAGNHAQGVALAAKKLEVQATIFMPENTPLLKVKATKSYGANVRLIGETFDDAFHESMEFQKATGATYVHPFDDFDVMAGQGTIALEMLEQVEDLETIIVPIGGGGLISGIARAAKLINPDITIIGVEAENACAMRESLQHNEHVILDKVNTIADGSAVKEPGVHTEKLVRQYVDSVHTVSEGEIANGMVYFLERKKTLVEGAGALALTYLLYHHDDIKGEKVGVIVSGGNLDLSKLNDICHLATETKQYEPVHS